MPVHYVLQPASDVGFQFRRYLWPEAEGLALRPNPRILRFPSGGGRLGLVDLEQPVIDFEDVVTGCLRLRSTRLQRYRDPFRFDVMVEDIAQHTVVLLPQPIANARECFVVVELVVA